MCEIAAAKSLLLRASNKSLGMTQVLYCFFLAFDTLLAGVHLVIS